MSVKNLIMKQVFYNPIKENRLVNDYTFAIRFKRFIQQTDVCDLPGEEEKEYLLQVADKLINYQCVTVSDNVEKEYLKRLNLI